MSWVVRVRWLTLVCLSIAVSVGRARADEPPAAPAPAAAAAVPAASYERAGTGGLAIELSAGGVSSGSIEGGLLLGLGVRGYVLGLFVDATREASSDPEPPNTSVTSSGSSRMGVAVRLPLVKTADGRVSLFAAGDVGFARRSVSLAPANGSASTYSADGLTWSLGPGLRFWLTEHLSLAYVTRLRSTSLSGTAGALS